MGGPCFVISLALECLVLRKKRVKTYHELLLDLAEALDTRGELEVVVRRGLGNGRDNGDPVALGADVVRGGDASDVDICSPVLSVN